MGFIRELQRRELHNRIPDVVRLWVCSGTHACALSTVSTACLTCCRAISVLAQVASMEADGLMVPAEAYAALMRSFLVMHRPSMALQAWRTYLRRGFRPTTSLYHMALAGAKRRHRG